MLHWFAKRLREVQEVRRDERGFTLIELLVVIIIIGILAAIAIPVFLSQRERAAEAAARANLRTAATAQESYFADQETYANDPAALSEYGFRQGDPPVAIASASTTGYCMTAGGFRLDSDEGTVQAGSCAA
jgi:type IV pilus assembly protein PilA